MEDRDKLYRHPNRQTRETVMKGERSKRGMKAVNRIKEKDTSGRLNKHGELQISAGTVSQFWERQAAGSLWKGEAIS